MYKLWILLTHHSLFINWMYTKIKHYNIIKKYEYLLALDSLFSNCMNLLT